MQTQKMLNGEKVGLAGERLAHSVQSNVHFLLADNKGKVADKSEQSSTSNTDEFIVGGKRIKLAKLARRAARERRRYLYLSLLNGIGLILAVSVSAILLSVSIGLVEFHGAATVTHRIDILNVIGRVLFAESFLAWFVFIFLDGWIFYPPSNPVDGRRGTTRGWYNAITFMVNEEPAEVADGLTKALNMSLRSKLRSSMIMVWGIFFALLPLVAVISTFENYFTDIRFSKALAVLVTENVAYFQASVVSFITLGRGDLTGVEAGTIFFSNEIALLLFLFMPFGSMWFGYQLIDNAIDMRWSLLSTPDILYKMLKNVLLVRNQARNYTLDDALKDARELTMEFGVDKIPEDFIDTDGQLFFYSENMRHEFLRGSSATV